MIASPSVTDEPFRCPCISLVYVETWLDRNGNATREPNEPPLPGASLEVLCPSPLHGEIGGGLALGYPDDGEGMGMSTSLKCTRENWSDCRQWVTDERGYAAAQASGCSCDFLEVRVETPSGYELTSHQKDGFWHVYGFAPLDDTTTPGTSGTERVLE
jgi:hypothetical protein